MSLTDGLLAYWKLDESSGNATDSFVNAKTLTNTGVTFGTGKINNGAIFDAGTDKLTDSSTFFDVRADISYAGWFNPSSLAAVNTLFGGWSTTSDERPFCWSDASGNVNIRGGTGGMVTTSGATLTAGTFYHIVVIITSGSYFVYINGTQRGTGSTGSFAGTMSTFNIGSRGDNANAFRGTIDEFGVWAKALSTAEISLLYNNGNGLAFPLDVTTKRPRPGSLGSML